MPLDKNNVFTIQTALGYNTFTDHCNTVCYEPFVNDDKTDCVPEKIDVFSHPSVTHRVVPLTLRPSLSPEGETSPSYGVVIEKSIQDSEVYTDGTQSQAS